MFGSFTIHVKPCPIRKGSFVETISPAPRQHDLANDVSIKVTAMENGFIFQNDLK